MVKWEARGFVAGHKRLIIAVFILVAAGIFIVTRIARKSDNPIYQTAVAERGTLIDSVTASGTVIATNNIDVTTSANGQISKVYVKEGDTVKKGQKLFEITLDAQGTQKLAQAYAALLAAQNALNSAKANYYNLQSAAFSANQKFINDAVARNLSTDDPTYIQENDEWLAAEANFNNAQNAINAAQANLTTASLAYNQASSTVVAPATGEIQNITVVPGMSIANSSSSSTSSSTATTVASIVTPGRPVATVNIAEADAVKVKQGQKATLTLDSITGATFTGKVAGINKLGTTNSGVTNYPATIEFDTESPKILPNMSVSASIITNVKDGVILVPSTSVITQNGQTMVRELKNGQLTNVLVTIGDKSDSQTEIVEGVNEGDVVITSVVDRSAQTNQRNGTSPFSGTRGFGTFGGGGGNVRVFTRN